MANRRKSNSRQIKPGRLDIYLSASTSTFPFFATTHFQLINPTTFQHYYLGISQIFPLITPSEEKDQAKVLVATTKI